MWPVIRRTATARTAPHRRYVREPKEGLEPQHGLYAGEPEACRRDYRHFLPVLAHLGLLYGVARVFRLEGRAYQSLVLIALAALPVHYYVPFRWKRPLFTAVSAIGMAWVFGLETSAVVMAMAAALIGVCYLPAPWILRAGLIATFAAGSAALRPGILSNSIPANVWPVLASMFMFRMMLYLYEIKHAKKPEPISDTLGYFFLLPNYCFLHFPVVDYRTYQRGYFSKDIHATMRTGLQMMFRGTVHLLLYRVIYHEILIAPEEVHGPLSLLGYLVCNYLLYLRVSGQFHIACGMLHLFGHSLPETHRHYLLAESFTDYWRRINIYWKDFMVRVVFNPVVFRLKRQGTTVALAVATAVVFLATWALHAYQSFWIRGHWGFSAPDALFWGVLGLLVMINVQFDARRSGAKPAKADANSLRTVTLRALKTAGTFATITLLWSLWSSPSVGAWVGMLRRGLGDR